MEELTAHSPAKIGGEQVRQAMETLKKYKAGKRNLEARIISNERWFRLQHWEELRRKSAPGEPEPSSAWLFNCIANKHADAMDSFPEAVVLPREQSDRQISELLSRILPVVLEQSDYEQVYSDMWWYKLKTGTGVTGIFWNAKKDGVGDIDVRAVDLLNLFWEPGVKDIQKSRSLFNVELRDRASLESEYPFLKDKLSSSVELGKYVYEDDVDVSGKCAVVDWYYKLQKNGKDILHYCKFCCDEVLYASENDPLLAERGFYDHGKYPFVFDVLFPEEGSPCGFGYIDVCKSPQAYIDKLDQCIQKYSVMAANPRFFVRADGNVNEAEYADWKKPFIHYHGSGDPRDNIFPLSLPTLSQTYISVRQLKIDELKETSGNRDFSQGGTSAGVTAASAIAALQEAGSKLSRDMLKSAYRAFRKTALLCIELMRQFYTEPRCFRIAGGDFCSFESGLIAPRPQSDAGIDLGSRLPVFDLDIKAQKSSVFATAAENERAKELFSLGFFRPELAEQAMIALEMMQFEGAERVRELIGRNAAINEKLRNRAMSKNSPEEGSAVQAEESSLAGLDDGSARAETVRREASI